MTYTRLYNGLASVSHSGLPSSPSRLLRFLPPHAHISHLPSSPRIRPTAPASNGRTLRGGRNVVVASKADPSCKKEVPAQIFLPRPVGNHPDFSFISGRELNLMNTSTLSALSTLQTTTMDIPLTSAPLKIALLLATGASVHFSLTPPHKAAPKTVVSNNKTFFERAVQWVTWCSKVCCLDIVRVK